MIFFLIYIREALNGLSIITKIFEQPKQIEKRMELAQICNNKFYSNFDILVDTMNNSFLDQFSCWPFRLFV